MSIFNAKFAPDVFEPVKAPILARCQSLWVRSCFGLRVILCYLLWPQGFTYVRRKGTPSKKSVNLDKFGGILCNKVGRRPSSDARTAVAHILLLWRDQVLLTRKVDLVVFEVERLQANFAWYFPNIIAYYALLRNFLPAVGPIEVHWSSSKMHSCWRIPLQGDHEGIHVFFARPSSFPIYCNSSDPSPFAASVLLKFLCSFGFRVWWTPTHQRLPPVSTNNIAFTRQKLEESTWSSSSFRICCYFRNVLQIFISQGPCRFHIEKIPCCHFFGGRIENGWKLRPT